MTPYIVTFELWKAVPVDHGRPVMYALKFVEHIREAGFGFHEEDAATRLKGELFRERTEQKFKRKEEGRLELRIMMVAPPVTADDYDLIAAAIRKQAARQPEA